MMELESNGRMENRNLHAVRKRTPVRRVPAPTPASPSVVMPGLVQTVELDRLFDPLDPSGPSVRVLIRNHEIGFEFTPARGPASFFALKDAQNLARGIWAFAEECVGYRIQELRLELDREERVADLEDRLSAAEAARKVAEDDAKDAEDRADWFQVNYNRVLEGVEIAEEQLSSLRTQLGALHRAIERNDDGSSEIETDKTQNAHQDQRKNGTGLEVVLGAVGDAQRTESRW